MPCDTVEISPKSRASRSSRHDKGSHLMTSPTAVTGVDFATVFTDDFPAAAEFYGGVLGLLCSVEYGKVAGAEFETGNLTLQVVEAAAVGRDFQPSTHPIALHVDDVELTRAALEAQGVKFLAETMDTGVCNMAPFEDSAGNVLLLHHRYAPRDGQASVAT
jgi:predicted enzyme related to lactoylglutathione lyase